MIIQERQYAKNEYEGLVKELMQSPDLKEEFRFKDSVLILNRLFFPRLFEAIDRIKNEATLSNNQRLISDLGDLEAGLMDYTNIIPSDLPDTILSDKRLTEDLLSNNQKMGRDNLEWLAFKDKIFEQSEILQPDQYLKFLEWCLAMLQMNWERHEKTCRNPNCPEEATYQKRIGFINKLVEEETPQPAIEVESLINLLETAKVGGKKIQWLGTQKELAELFIRLRAKGWIADFEPDTIKECFTKSDSIQQILKPGEYTEDLGGTFEQVFTPEYVSKFHGVMPNPKRN